jgi:hypothetical protein
LPWGQDRLVPIFLATLAIRQQSARITFGSAAEMLDTFGLRQGGSQYRRLVASFQRIFGAKIFFGTDVQRERAAVVHRARFNFMTEARISKQSTPPAQPRHHRANRRAGHAGDLLAGESAHIGQDQRLAERRRDPSESLRSRPSR